MCYLPSIKFTGAKYPASYIIGYPLGLRPALRDRFGMDAVKFINSKQGKSLRLRGLFAQIVQEGIVRLGDRVQKV